MAASPIDPRTPPHNLDAEASTLGSMMVDNRVISANYNLLHPEDFYSEANQAIYIAVIDLFNHSIPIDVVSVHDKLSQTGNLDRSGGWEYLTHCINSVYSTHNTDYYVKIIKEKSELRSLIKACSDISLNAFQQQNELDEIISDAESRIYQIRNRRMAGESTLLSIREALDSTMDEIQNMEVNKWKYTGVPSGFYDLDNITNGFQRTDLIIVAARPGMGKTSFVLNVAEYAAINAKQNVLIFSLEMGYNQLCQRMLCSMARVNMKLLRSGKIVEHLGLLDELMGSADELAGAQLHLDDKSNPTVPEMMAKCRMLENRYGKLDLIIVDYLQLIPPSSSRSFDSRNYQIAEVVRALKQMAKDLNVPVIAVAQLSRAVEERKGRRPQLSDLRDSGEIEATADVVMFVHRDDYYHKSEDDEPEDTLQPGECELIVAKHRNGEIGSAKLRFRPELTRFENPAMASTEKAAPPSNVYSMPSDEPPTDNPPF
jgi:replicative DNA helicase